MASRTALVLETNPVITERYLDYTHDSDWRIMLKDSLNGFLEKLQHEKFSLIVAEESLVPQGIIQMMKATGVPLLLSSNVKHADIQTLPRNFNRTELLTVFDRLVPPVLEEFNESEDEKTEPFGGQDEVHNILSDLEDEEDDFFELSSNDVVLEPSSTPQDTENIKAENDFKIIHDSSQTSDANSFDDEDFMSDEVEKTTEFQTSNAENAQKSNHKNSKDNLFAPPPSSLFDNNNSEIDDLVNSLSVDFKPQETENSVELNSKEEKYEENQLFAEQTENPLQKNNYEPEKPQTEMNPSEIKAAVFEWMEKNARNIIKETVIEQLASLSGKNND